MGVLSARDQRPGSSGSGLRGLPAAWIFMSTLSLVHPHANYGVLVPTVIRQPVVPGRLVPTMVQQPVVPGGLVPTMAQQLVVSVGWSLLWSSSLLSPVGWSIS